MKIDKKIIDRKSELLRYFRNRATEILADLQNEYGKRPYKKITQKIQPAIRESRDSLIRTIQQTAQREKWDSKILLSAILLIHHAANVIMLEFRHSLWPYEYMAFSRRIGELWESLIGNCFHYPVAENLVLEVPPLFSDIKNKLDNKILEYISHLPINEKQKEELLNYYKKVWLLVDSGEIKLELDMHFKLNDEHFNIDFKSGFSSNEKGNTNRLLVVSSIYTNIIDKNYRNLILVRSPEEENNHYLQILKRSKLWEVSCGKETYEKINELVDFNINNWIEENIDWESDLENSVVADLKKSDLMKYLKW